MAPVILDNPGLFLGGVFVLGLLVGSFLNVVILRLPARLEHDWRCQCHELLGTGEAPAGPAPPGLVWQPSACPACGHRIRPWENIPVISYLFLRGRCSACKERISLRYPLVELITAALFTMVAAHFGPTLAFLAAIVLTGFLISLTGIDIDHQLLPDDMTLMLLWTGLFFSLFGVFTTPVDSIIGALAGYLSLWLLYHLFRLVTGKEGMGFGDFKLLAAMGAWLGWSALPLVVVLSSVVGAVVGVTLMAVRGHERDKPIPFGPFIAAAGWIALLWGDRITHTYLRMSGLG